MASSNNRNLKILDSLKSKVEKSQFMASGNVTTGTLIQFIDEKFIVKHIGKVRGIIVDIDGKYKFDTEAEARIHAIKYRAICRQEVRANEQSKGQRIYDTKFN